MKYIVQNTALKRDYEPTLFGKRIADDFFSQLRYGVTLQISFVVQDNTRRH